jgi:hypothetical protein
MAHVIVVCSHVLEVSIRGFFSQNVVSFVK